MAKWENHVHRKTRNTYSKSHPDTWRPGNYIADPVQSALQDTAASRLQYFGRNQHFLVVLFFSLREFFKFFSDLVSCRAGPEMIND